MLSYGPEQEVSAMAVRIQTGVRTRKACEIAGIDSARFNEMVHARHFPCAPETRPGSARIFSLDRTVALKIFGDLLSMSFAPDRAGQIACSAYRLFSGQQNVERLVYLRDAFGEWVMKEEGLLPQMTMSPTPRLVLDIAELREHVGDCHDWQQTPGKGGENAAP